jgi:hypothetical protein
MFSARRLLLACYMVSFLSLPLLGAKFKGFNRPEQQAVLNVPSSPEVAVPFHTLALAVENPTGAFPYGPQLRANIDKELTGAFSIVQVGGEGTLTVSVLEFAQPAASFYVVKEVRAVAANNQPAPASNTSKKGWASVLNSLTSTTGQVPVQYWQAQGQLTIKAVLKDKTGATIDETILKAPFSMKRETAVNNVPSIDPAALPQQGAIVGYLLREGARKVRRRYAIGLEPTLVKLPVDNELLAGNRMAMEDNWEGALKAWQAAPSKSNLADQKFSMALANYALTFKTFAEMQDTDAAVTQYETAAHLLAEARTIDPKESYFVEIDSRMAAAKGEIDKAAQQAKALALGRDRKALRDAETSGSSLAAGGKSLTPDQPDTPQQAEFRTYIHAQWKNRRQPPADADLKQLVETGRLGWKLTPEEARQVVQSEANAWTDRKSKIDVYLSQLKGFIEGGILSAEGRSQLRKLSANLGLTDAEVAAIESKVPFREPGRARAAGPRP